jgi:secreted trypsin-like serine protease
MDQIKVKVGEYNFNEAGETLDSTYALSSMVYHENYNTKTYENDIAVLKLERPVTFSRWATPGLGCCLGPRGRGPRT